jgi:hypothetical protein
MPLLDYRIYFSSQRNSEERGQRCYCWRTNTGLIAIGNAENYACVWTSPVKAPQMILTPKLAKPASTISYLLLLALFLEEI